MATKFRYRFLALGLLTACTLTSLASRATADGVDPFFDIMHRAQLGNIRSLPEYSKDQQENLGSEASDFRTRQRALILQNQQQPQQSGSTTPAQPGTNPQPQL